MNEQKKFSSKDAENITEFNKVFGKFMQLFDPKGTSYDSTKDFMRHKETVVFEMLKMIDKLRVRALHHDDSRLSTVEKEMFDNLKDNLKRVKYEGPEYNKLMESLDNGKKHHEELNSHHPEYYPNGILGMNVLDILEMIADWYAYSERSRTNIYEVIEAKQKKYNMSDDLKQIIINTLKDVMEK